MAMTRFVLIVLLFGPAVRSAFGQSVPADSSVRLCAIQAFTACEKAAEPTVRAVLKYRIHLGIWPIEDGELRAFLAENAITLPSVDPCRVSGDVDGAVVSLSVGDGHAPAILLPDSSSVRRADARFYLTAEVSAATLQATITSELRDAEVVSRNGRLTALPPYAPGAARIVRMPLSIPDSVLFHR